MKNKWICALLLLLTASIGVASAEKVTVGEIIGLVMLNNEGVFVKVDLGMELEKGDQIYVLENSSALLIQGSDCAARLNANELFELNQSDLCAKNSSLITSKGPKLVAAIGLDEPISATGFDTGEVLEGQENSVDEDAAMLPENRGFFSGIAAKLAIPATLTGAVLFSTIAGGGGGVREPISPE